jgi:two-component system, chemotaxis family, sensor histidine kinase and response regulator WspE
VSGQDLSDLSMMDLFRLDAESQVQTLDAGLLALERDNVAVTHLESCMRAAHSLKGAARVVGLSVGVEVAHAMEDCFVAAQRGALLLGRAQIDVLLQGADLLKRIAETPEAELGEWAGARRLEIDVFLSALRDTVAKARETGAPPATAAPQAAPEAAAAGAPQAAAAPQAAVAPQATTAPQAAAAPAVPAPQGAAASPGARSRAAAAPAQPPAAAGFEDPEIGDRVLRVTAEHLNRLLGLAGESLVESRRLKPFSQSLFRLKRLQNSTAASVDTLREAVSDEGMSEAVETALTDVRQRIDACHQLLAQQIVEMDLFDSLSTNLAHRMYASALACRMRPFADGVRALPRMVRDVGRTLGKQVHLDIVGDTTQVDRDILEKLDAPLGHLLRNAVDHGIEEPEARLAAGKPAEGIVRLEARHSAGQLMITASDDGRGIDLAKVRRAIVERKLTNDETAQKLSDAELYEFLFLPGFTMKSDVTEISGRGVGLDVVQSMLKQVRGTIRVSSEIGRGSRFQMQLPLTLSVVRTLLVEIGGEPYAFPLAHIVRTLKLPQESIEVLEGRQHFKLNGRSIGLVSAQQVFGGGERKIADGELSVIILGDAANPYALVTDKFLGERDLVVQPLEKRLGKIKDIAAGSLMEDGSPVLIVDIDDMLRSVEKFVTDGRLSKVERAADSSVRAARRRVLVVDDSLTVRELERKLLDQAGYDVEIAVDGVDGWNAVRASDFDLIVTDVDMPRMDGIELVRMIRQDPKLAKLPVMIVSYKDREEDRRRGLEAGADYYLTKGSFHDDTLQQAVADLIGAAA